MINLLLREIERFHNQLDTAAGIRDFGLIERHIGITQSYSVTRLIQAG